MTTHPVSSDPNREQGDATAHRLEPLFNSANDAMMLYHLDEQGDPGRFIEVNEAAVRLYGYSRTDFLRITPRQILDPALDYKQAIRKLLVDGTMLRESTHVTKDGRKITAEVSAHRFWLGGRNTILTICRDLTERRRVEDDLRLQAQILQNMTEGVSVTDESGVILYTNAAEDRMFGYEPGELVGRHVSVQNAYPPQENQRIIAAVIERLKTGGSWSGEWHNLKKDGTDFYTYGRISGLKMGGRRCWVCVQHDITQRKKAEQALRESEARKSGILESAMDCIITMDSDGRIMDFNPAAERTFGHAREQVVGRPLAEIVIPPRLRAAHNRGLKRLLDTGKGRLLNRRVEMPALRADGSEFPVELTVTATYLDGHTPFFTGYLRDITEAKQAQEQLVALNESLEQRVAERTAVAEQRAEQLTVLAAELTNAEQHERRRLAQTLHDGLQQLLVAAKLRLGVVSVRGADPVVRDPLRQVEDLLDQSVAMSRSLTVQLSPPILYDAGLSPALEWLIRWMRQTHDLTVQATLDPAAEPEAEAIRVVLFEAVRELLFNVVKHSGVKTATMKMFRVGEDQTRIIIADAGIGFDPVGAAAGLPDSPGIGLISLRQRLEFLGGRLEVDSRPGGGTRMSLTAPRLRPEAARRAAPAGGARAPAVPAAATGRNRPSSTSAGESAGGGTGRTIRVLLADDHKILRQGLVSLLEEEEDIDVVGEAEDGEMAVEMAMRAEPDVIVMDITMPRMTGIEATRRITAAMPHVRVIGLSMHTESDMAAALREAGAVDYVTKGGPSEELIAAIRGRH